MVEAHLHIIYFANIRLRDNYFARHFVCFERTYRIAKCTRIRFKQKYNQQCFAHLFG